MVLLILALPPVPGTATHPVSGSPGSVTSALPHSTVAAVPLLVRAMATATSFDWDGMGFLSARGVSPAAAGGEGAQLIADDALKTGVMFGGEGQPGLTNITLSLNQTTAAWRDVSKSVAPSPRANFSFASDPIGGFAVLFGGLVDLRTDRCDNQTWIYWFSNQTWENVSRPNAPPSRESAAFAIDPPNGTAVLEGGWDPYYTTSSGSTGVVTWNDTWTFNLSTMLWSEQHPGRSPSPMFGSAMDWVPVVHQFQLFGGCFNGCSNTMWTYVPGSNWSVVAPFNAPPSARAATTFSWAASANLTFMFGGFAYAGQTLVADNHTYFYDPALREWNYVQGPPDPFRRYAAPGTWLSANQCPGFFLIGGSSSIASPPPDQWFLDPNPDTEIGCNTWGNDRVGNNSGGNGTGLPPGCVADANLSVLALSTTTGLPINNGTVYLSGYCGPYNARLNSFGYANFTKVPAWLTDVRATAPGYRSNGTFLNLTPNATSYLVFNLTPLPVLHLHARGVEVGGARVDLPGVDLWVNGAPTSNRTDARGWWNVTGLNVPLGAVTFTGLLANYSSPTVNAIWPYTGTVWVNLTLLAFGPFEVRVQVAGTTTPIPGASGVVTPVDPVPQGGVVGFRTAANGTWGTLIPAGNYTVEVGAPGFLPATTKSPLFHPWATITQVTINLTFKSSFILDVRLLDAKTHAPIPGGTVLVGATRTMNTSSSGWGNFTSITPAGQYAVYGTAPGYRGNGTAVVFSYFLSPTVRLQLNLTPLFLCEPTCGGRNATTPVQFTLLPPGGWGLTWLTAAPLIFVIGALAYWAGSRRRLGAEAPA